MRKLRSTIGRQDGFTTVILLSLLLMMLLAGISVLRTSTDEILIAGHEYNQQQAFDIAEGAINHAAAKLNQNIHWRSGFTNQVLGHGKYSLTVLDSAVQPSLGEELVLKSTGECRGRFVSLEAHYAPDHKSRFSYAVFAKDLLKIESNGWTDSYSSDSGTYASQALNGPDASGNMYANNKGSIGGNAVINLASGARIHGDALTSKNGGLNITGATVYGDSSTTHEPEVLDPIPAGEITYAQSNNAAKTSALTLSGSASFNNGSCELKIGGGTAILNSGTYYFSKVTMDGGGRLELAPGAQVKAYVTGDWSITGGVFANNGGAPGDFQIFSTGTQFEFSGGSGLNAAVYAPDAKIFISGAGNAYGSYVGYQFTMSGGAHLHYDEALSKIKGPQIAGYKMISWRSSI